MASFVKRTPHPTQVPDSACTQTARQADSWWSAGAETLCVSSACQRRGPVNRSSKALDSSVGVHYKSSGATGLARRQRANESRHGRDSGEDNKPMRRTYLSSAAFAGI